MNLRIFLSKEFPNDSGRTNFLFNFGDNFEYGYYIVNLTEIRMNLNNPSWLFNKYAESKHFDTSKSYTMEELKDKLPEYFV